jgi:D-serine deaminase-like pyridoxal phosphate-dependent protein
VKVALDSHEALTALAAAAREAGRTIGVLVELDVGLGRVGVQRPEEAVRLARAAAECDGVAFRGLLFYPGQIRMAFSEQDEHVAVVRARVEACLEALRDDGLPPEIVSGGSTPTLWRSHEVEGTTEIRSGSCIFFDREGVDVGVASPDDVAYTVLATVVSTAVPGRAVIDAGSKALSKERRGGGGGFGVLRDRPGVPVVSLSEEHGVLDVSASDWVPRIGERVPRMRVGEPPGSVARVRPRGAQAARSRGARPWPLVGARADGLSAEVPHPCGRRRGSVWKTTPEVGHDSESKEQR